MTTLPPLYAPRVDDPARPFQSEGDQAENRRRIEALLRWLTRRTT